MEGGSENTLLANSSLPLPSHSQPHYLLGLKVP